MQLKDEINLLISEKKFFIKEKNSHIFLLQQKHIDLFLKKKGFSFIEKKNNYKDINYIFYQDYHIFFNKKKENIKYEEIEKLIFIKNKKSILFIFIDGEYNSYFSHLNVDTKNIILSNISSQKEDIIKIYYDKLSYKYNIFYTLNTLFSRDSVYIYIPNNVIVNVPIEILHISTGIESNIMLNTRNLIIVGEGSHVKIIEHHKSLKKHSSFINTATEIYALNNSKIDYYKIQDDLFKTSMIDNTFLKQKKNSICNMYTFSFKGDKIKNNLNFYSCGEKTYSYLYGISLLSGKQFLDNQTLIKHSYSNTYSYQLYKNILCRKSKGIFNGKIIINKSIKKVNAFQKNNNIVLSDEAYMYTKPQLEIYSNNVKCSHGCTIGNIQESELFYLQSRGIPEKNSKILLLLSLLEEILKSINILKLKKFIYKKIKEKLDK
ncbi:Fe-S cluster assembly protein SufD [Blattabacterium cuenoti]|uniref:Fe-S cluster assembly protein SufD n=1 Tax=Blattabacterium cuenoti TaxID=1653831 RepID=UPI00163CF86D|nr:Fe-S cluster assembly protein SufD [Blattabacterium cuenoti]